MRKRDTVRNDLKRLKVQANTPRKHYKSQRVNILEEHKQSRHDGNASVGRNPAVPQEDFTVPDGDRRKRMERYCKKFCDVDLVIEARSEKDSWKSVSRKGNASKESKTNQRSGIKFKIRSVRSQGISYEAENQQRSNGHSENEAQREEKKQPVAVN